MVKKRPVNRIKRSFALFPHDTSFYQRVWLEHYYSYQTMRFNFGRYNGYETIFQLTSDEYTWLKNYISVNLTMNHGTKRHEFAQDLYDKFLKVFKDCHNLRDKRTNFYHMVLIMIEEEYERRNPKATKRK